MKQLTFSVAVLWLGAAFTVAATVQAAAEEPAGSVELALAADGTAQQSIVLGPNADQRTRDAADDLADVLERISGAAFEIIEGNGATGIAVGAYRDFPDLDLGARFDPDDISRRDEYLLRTHEDGAHLVGATDLAAQHAVWDFLHRLGHRQFFPTKTWEVIPHEPDLRIAVDVFERPDFYNRMGPRSAPWSDNERWSRWHDRNRMTSAFTLRTGHSYNGIIRRNESAFEERPEYLALVDGERGGGRGDKFCISNEGLRELVVEDALARAEPGMDSISMDPSDGGDWCECEDCAQMGSVSDRVVILANEVAEAINEQHGDETYVGIYAYASHSPPPSVDVHPKVIVSIATSFIRGGYTLDELVDGWSERTQMIGIREYHDVHTWSQAMPRRARGGDVRYLTERIPYFHERGARFMNSESADSWGANGLGYYLSAGLLWDVDAANRVDEIVDDFADKAFGRACEPMREFYHLIAEDYETVRTDEDLLARMYRHLDDARALTDDTDILARLDELALYTRYVELMFKFHDAENDTAREEAAQHVFRHAYRMRDSMFVHSRALFRWLRRRGVDVPDEADPGNLAVGQPGEDVPPWKCSQPFDTEEIAGFVEAGLAHYEQMAMEFQPVSFSEELAPAAEALALPEVPTGCFGRNNTFRGQHVMFTWLEPEAPVLNLRVTGGLIKHYRDRGNVRFRLYSPKEPDAEPVDTDESAPPDGTTYDIHLESPYSGLHRLEWADGNDRTRVEWAENTPMTVRSCMNEPASLPGNRRLYFYVPKGTETVGGFTTHHRGDVLDSDGNQVFDFGSVEGGEGHFNIAVPPGQDGALWRISGAYGDQMLMTVPPYLARNEKELLLPREVIEADAAE